MKSFKTFIFEKSVDGSLIHHAGIGMEHELTKRIGYYIGKIKKGLSHEDAKNMTIHGPKGSKGVNARFRYSRMGKTNPDSPVIKAYKTLGKEQFKSIKLDAKTSVGHILDHINKYYGKLTGVMHTGGDVQGHAVEKFTGGKKSNADLLFQVQNPHTGETSHLKFIGSSMKYSVGGEKSSNTIKVVSHSPVKFGKMLDDAHRKIYGSHPNYQSPNLEQEYINAAKGAKEKKIEVAKKHDSLLKQIFSTPFRNKNNEPVKYENGVLNPGAKSHIRRIKEGKLNPEQAHHIEHQAAITKFYDEYSKAGAGDTSSVIGKTAKVIKDIVGNHAASGNPNHRNISNMVLRSIGNIPERRNSKAVKTVITHVARTVDKNGKRVGNPTTTMYDASKGIRNYIDSVGNGEHEVKHNPGTSGMRIGPYLVSFDRGKNINVQIDKKSLPEEGKYRG